MYCLTCQATAEVKKSKGIEKNKLLNADKLTIITEESDLPEPNDTNIL